MRKLPPITEKTQFNSKLPANEADIKSDIERIQAEKEEIVSLQAEISNLKKEIVDVFDGTSAKPAHDSDRHILRSNKLAEIVKKDQEISKKLRSMSQKNQVQPIESSKNLKQEKVEDKEEEERETSAQTPALQDSSTSIAIQKVAIELRKKCDEHPELQHIFDEDNFKELQATVRNEFKRFFPHKYVTFSVISLGLTENIKLDFLFLRKVLLQL